ncbi:cytochrome P450 [Saccharopolyspora lacisalsi]|uniref:Cytochrome P450 n=1 Tax=Halosaccharopolyspora lacisalsi TaxID=1000566 RepID=A0A839E743_9PSEU|nr:cytochrome P450 [Halosaccharopolyspora lacisalsi]MBA8827517.1 cytochrome P450 [Halosaccharopolyspora lacisalsi]
MTPPHGNGFVHPFAPSARTNPYPGYRWLQQNSPVHYDRKTSMWLLTRHADCARALREARLSAELGQRQRLRDDELPVSMLTTDPPRHEQLRSPGQAMLAPAVLRQHLPGIHDGLQRVLDELDTPNTVDAVADIGERFAETVLAETLSISAAQRTIFTDMARRVSPSLNPLASGAQAEGATEAMRELDVFLDEHLDRVVEHGTDGPIRRLALDERLTRHQVIGVLSLSIVGGFEPLSHLVANALVWLLGRPAEIERIRDGDARFALGAVDELLRVESPVPFTARVTTDDVVFGDTVIPADQRVLIMIGAANRDPEVFEQPDGLLLARSPNPYLALGSGTHYCLGAGLVRECGALFLPELLRRYPKLHAASPEQLDTPRWRDALIPRGMQELAVAVRG